jgi:serine/threonine-protein kinase
VKTPTDPPRPHLATSPERWAHIRSLVDRTLALPVEARDEFLLQACAGDGALNGQVRRLVELCERGDGDWSFLSHAAGMLAAPLVADGTTPLDDRGLRSGPPAGFLAAIADRYAVGAEIGRGGMATVYVADDVRHHRRVALKILDPHVAVLLGADRFLAEIRVTAGLQHPNLMPLFDSGEACGLLYYVMPLVDGVTLRSRLREAGRLPLDAAMTIVRTIAVALDYAHRQGVVHRDLKPENILLHDDQVLVADFGIALAVTNAADARLTASIRALGTPQYMSPEQTDPDAVPDGRSDIYSLGCMLFELLAGEPPFRAAGMHAVLTPAREEPMRRLRALRTDVPTHVIAAIARALSVSPADRYATAREFADALDLDRSATVPAWRRAARLTITQ